MAQHTALGDDAVMAAEGNVAQYQARTSQEDALEAKQYRRHVLARMSHTTRLVVELLESPPAWLMDEFKAMRAKIKWCRTRGFFASGAKDVSLGLIFQAIGLDKTQRERVNAEIRRLASAGA